MLSFINSSVDSCFICHLPYKKYCIVLLKSNEEIRISVSINKYNKLQTVDLFLKKFYLISEVKKNHKRTEISAGL